MDNYNGNWNFRKVFSLQNISNAGLLITILALLVGSAAVNIAFSGTVDLPKIILRAILITLTLLLVSNITIQEAFEKNDKLKTEIAKNASLEAMLDTSFDKFLVEENFRLKKKSWTDKIKYEVRLLDKKASVEDKYIYFVDLKKLTSDKAAEIEVKRQTNEYYINRVKLLNQTEEEWLNEHIDSIDIEYPVINALDLRIEETKKDSDGAIRLDAAKVRAAKIWPKVAFSFVLAIFIGLIAVDVMESPTSEVIIRILMDVVLLVANIQFGMTVGTDTIKLGYLAFYIRKSDLYSRYIQWVQKNGVEESKVKRLLSLVEAQAKADADRAKKEAELAKQVK
jgi:hypothetical protein